jgi:sugar transferase (PEP-CTERM/EpsH1 system associated)
MDAKRVKVLHVVLSLDTGGLEHFVVNLIKSYSEQIESRVVSLARKGVLADNLKGTAVIELNKEPGIRISLIWHLIKIIKKHGIQLVHTHNSGPMFYGGIAGFLSGIPVIHTRHGRNDVRNETLINWISSIFANKIITVSRDSADLCRKELKISPRKIETIWNGVDTEIFKPALNKGSLRKELSVNDNSFVIGCVARLSPEKDHATLLKAVKILKDRNRNVSLVIAGGGVLDFKLKELSRELGVETEVRFLGLRSDITHILMALDVFVLSSLTEGIPLSILEAQACGIPVIATDVGGNSEVVLAGISGFLVATQHPCLIAEKIEQLIDNPTMAKTMGEMGRKRIEDEFSLRESSKKYVSVYCESIERIKCT